MSSAPTSVTEFPSPAERPNADIVIYDGNCKFCRTQVRRLLWWDCQHKLSYLSLHDPEVPRRFPNLTHEQMMEQMYVVDRKGNQYGGAGALRHLSLRLRRLWWLAPVLHIPFTLPIWKWLYRQVASRRYRLSGAADCDEGTCSVHQGKGVRD